MNPALKATVFGIIARTVDIDPSALDADRDIAEQVSLDSMEFVRVSAAIEKELDIELPLRVMEVRTLNEFLEIVLESMG